MSRKRMEDYLEAVARRLEENPYWRIGQTHFNVLFFDGFDPEFANSIRGGELDPFYTDGRLESMLSALALKWSNE